MKDREVIETLNDMKGVFGERGHSQYSLYSVDRAIEAIEKQIPKKPIESGISLDDFEIITYICPVCNKEITNEKYCSNCGQRLRLY